MYVITTIIVICVILLFLRGLYLSHLDSLKEGNPPPRQLTNEEKLRAAYRNAYFANLSLSDDEWKALVLPAYPVHDCLIVRHLDLDRSVHVFRDIIYQYCKEMSGLEVLIPLSIDTPKGLKIDSYDINKLKGKYLS